MVVLNEAAVKDMKDCFKEIMEAGLVDFTDYIDKDSAGARAMEAILGYPLRWPDDEDSDHSV